MDPEAAGVEAVASDARAARPRRVKVLLNVGAGTASKANCAQLVVDLKRAFAAHEVAANVLAVPGEAYEAEVEQARQQAARGEIDAIVAAGGDGSVHTLAASLADSGVPMGVIPLGTLNHFAKDLRIPLELDAAVGVIAQGHRGAVDVGDVNGRVFINNSSIGVYPFLVLERERRMRRDGLSKWSAMLFAAWRVLRNAPLRRLRVRAGADVEVNRSPCIFVGNNEYQLKGLDFGTRLALTSGRLCVFIARRESPLSLLWVALRSILGLLDVETDLKAMILTEVTIDTRHRLLVAMDGEIELLRGPLAYRTRPAALQVFMPASDGSISTCC